MKYAIPRKRLVVAALAAAALLTAPAWAGAATTHYATHFTTLNHSGVTGSASASFNSATNILTVHIHATGLMPNEPHPQHIHGELSNGFSGTPVQSTTPSLAANDTNHDGVLEVTEGAATYGPILVPLTLSGTASGSFPTASNGTINYTQTFDVTNPAIYFTSPVNGFHATESDLDPMNLNLREIVIHGMDAPINITNGGLNGKTFFAAGTYDPFIPLVSGVFTTAVPEPADLGMMAGGLGLLLGFLWLRRKDFLQSENT